MNEPKHNLFQRAIKALFLRYVWPLEVDASSYSAEAVINATLLKSMSIDEQRGINASVSMDADGPARVMLDFFAHLALKGCENYREFSLTWRAKKAGEEDIPCVVTVQRVFGLTPHQAREKAERELAECKAAIAKATPCPTK